MKELSNYLNNNQIKDNLTNEHLLELKELLIKEEESFLFNRSKDCFLWEINQRLKEN